MARKLYVFNVTGRAKVAAGSAGPQWAGNFSNSYSYLGDFAARLLGINAHLAVNRMPKWVHNPPPGARTGRGGASRSDEKSWGWGR